MFRWLFTYEIDKKQKQNYRQFCFISVLLLRHTSEVKRYNYACTVCPRMTKIGTVRHGMEVRETLGGLPHPHPKGEGPSIPEIWVDPYLCPYSDQIWYGDT